MKNQINFLKKMPFCIIFFSVWSQLFYIKTNEFEMLHTSAIHSGGKQVCHVLLIFVSQAFLLQSSSMPVFVRRPGRKWLAGKGRTRTVCSL